MSAVSAGMINWVIGTQSVVFRLNGVKETHGLEKPSFSFHLSKLQYLCMANRYLYFTCASLNQLSSTL